MTHILIATVAAFALSAPAFANSQLAASAGADGADHSVAELAALHFGTSHETGDGPRIDADTVGRHLVVSTADRSRDLIKRARLHVAQDESDAGDRRLIRSGGKLIVSTSNRDLTAFANAKLRNNERGDGDNENR